MSDTGRNKGGPRDDGNDSDENGSFDPPESFDAHNRAAGRRPRRAQFKTQHFKTPQVKTPLAGSDPFEITESTAAATEHTQPAEPTYSRSRDSRRTSGDATGDAKSRQNEAKKSQRPARSLKGRALGYLSRREYSRSELARKLKPFVEETDSLDTLLDTLEAENWLSDSRFAESLIHRRSSRLGANRIVGELKQHSVDQTLVEEASIQLRETELARAQAVWRKKFGQLPETPAERAKQARFLASRGFSGATIGKILKGIDEE
ncbi:Regulatory protein RecX [Paraburkholderia rhynchosiae]|uniref:Regulatory protein RecX n=1 Tax=Paraburkholderia rhynchosiae TaxID=487049 RepID=A0A6J5AJH2_9BURK|nr:Regulatory protein RecX [Paraburkholderia rhynchosiae]